MIRYAWKTLAAELRAGGLLYALTIFGVALGVGSVSCVQIINQNAIASFRAAIKAISGDADMSVLPISGPLPSSFLPRVLATPGVASASPLDQIDVALWGRKDYFLTVVGIDVFANDLSKESGISVNNALSTPGWCVLMPELADELGLRPGRSFDVSSGSRRVALVAGAVVDLRRRSPQATRKILVMDIAQVQSLFGAPNEITQIDVRVQKGAAVSEVARALRERLGPSVDVFTPEQRESQASALLRAFRLNLTALSLISLFVGLFLIFSSTQAALVRRRSEFGLLRSLGAGRGQVLGLILGEVGALAVIGVAVGLPLGYAAAKANLSTVSATLSNLYILSEIESLRVPAWVAALSAAIGVGGALAGAALPALDMSRRDTKSLLSAFTLNERVGAAAPVMFGAGVLLLAFTLAWYVLVGKTWEPAGFVLAVALLLSVPLFTPAVIRVLCGWVPLRSIGFSFSVKSLGVRLGTTAVAVASLAIAVSVLTGVTLMVGSFRATVDAWIAKSLQADVYVTTKSWKRARQAATMDFRLEGILAGQYGVRAVDRVRQVFVRAYGRRIPLSGVEMGIPNPMSRFSLTEALDPYETAEKIRHGGALIGEPLARKAHLSIGSTLAVDGPGGPASFPVEGIFYDYGSENGSAVIDLNVMNRRFGAGPVTNMALYLEPRRKADEMAETMTAWFAEAPLQFRSNTQLRKDVMRIFDQTFAITRILELICLLVATCGVALTLLVLARERVSEIALLRALGATPFQTFNVFLGKGLGIGLFGMTIGGACGGALMFILVLINRAYFGWTIQRHWPGHILLNEMGLIALAILGASLYPALKASRVSAGQLSREDL